jgi:hypothetical protein
MCEAAESKQKLLEYIVDNSPMTVDEFISSQTEKRLWLGFEYTEIDFLVSLQAMGNVRVDFQANSISIS